jgi:hypothetical protein
MSGECRQDLLDQGEADFRASLDEMQMRAFMGQPATRTFVCQGCGKTHAVLHGAGIKCGCGVTSAAEVLP